MEVDSELIPVQEPDLPGEGKKIQFDPAQLITPPGTKVRLWLEDDKDEDEVAVIDVEATRKPPLKKKTSQQLLKDRYERGDPEVALLGEPSGKF